MSLQLKEKYTNLEDAQVWASQLWYDDRDYCNQQWTLGKIVEDVVETEIMKTLTTGSDSGECDKGKPVIKGGRHKTKLRKKSVLRPGCVK